MWLVFIIISIAYPQEGKELPLKKQPQGEVAADSDQYVIGPEDVLYIHVWREDVLSRTIPVRTDGKISMPLIQEIQAAGLTPLEAKGGLNRKIKRIYRDS